MGDKSPSAGAGGTNGRGKPAIPQGSGAGLDQAERDAREYLPFDSDRQMINLTQSLYDAHLQDMDREDLAALETYKGDAFTEMNAFLRNPETWKEYANDMFGDTPEGWGQRRFIEDQVSILKNAPTRPLGEDTMLYRGMDFEMTGRNALRDLLYDGEKNGSLVGATFTDKGFGSTSLKDTPSEYGVIMNIRAPRETKVWSPDPYGENGYEREILLKPNTSYTVRSYSRNEFGNLVVEVDID